MNLNRKGRHEMKYFSLIIAFSFFLAVGCVGDEETIKALVEDEVLEEIVPPEIEEPGIEEPVIPEPVILPDVRGTPPVVPVEDDSDDMEDMEGCSEELVTVGELPEDLLRTTCTGTISEQFQEVEFEQEIEIDPNIRHCLLFEKTSNARVGCSNPKIKVYFYSTTRGDRAVHKNIYENVGTLTTFSPANPNLTAPTVLFAHAYLHWGRYEDLSLNIRFAVKDEGVSANCFLPYGYRFVHHPCLHCEERTMEEEADAPFGECKFE